MVYNYKITEVLNEVHSFILNNAHRAPHTYRTYFSKVNYLLPSFVFNSWYSFPGHSNNHQSTSTSFGGSIANSDSILSPYLNSFSYQLWKHQIFLIGLYSENSSMFSEMSCLPVSRLVLDIFIWINEKFNQDLSVSVVFWLPDTVFLHVPYIFSLDTDARANLELFPLVIRGYAFLSDVGWAFMGFRLPCKSFPCISICFRSHICIQKILHLWYTWSGEVACPTAISQISYSVFMEKPLIFLFALKKKKYLASIKMVL